MAHQPPEIETYILNNMCDPVSISLAMTAAGSAAQAAGQSKARKAMDDARQAERIRQQGLQAGSNSLVSESLANASAESQNQQQGKATDARKAAYDTAQAAAPAALTPSNTSNAGDQKANSIVNTEAGQRSAAAHGYASQQGGAKAALQGFNDLQKTDNIYNNRMLGQQATIGNFMQGSAGVLPYEVEAAGHRGDSMKSLGDLLSLGGAAVGMGAGSGLFSPKVAADAAKTAASTGLFSSTGDAINGINNLNTQSNLLQTANPWLSPGTYNPYNNPFQTMKYIPLR